jgi:hypothetical protein
LDKKEFFEWANAFSEHYNMCPGSSGTTNDIQYANSGINLFSGVETGGITFV